jgi:hypothetical protein
MIDFAKYFLLYWETQQLKKGRKSDSSKNKVLLQKCKYDYRVLITHYQVAVTAFKKIVYD